MFNMKLNTFYMTIIFSVVAVQIEAAPVEVTHPTPCFYKQSQISAEWEENEETFPSLYFPQCDEDGIEWQPTQCDFFDANNCFCVNPKTGEVIEGTEFQRSTRNSTCISDPVKPVPVEGACHAALRKYLDFTNNSPYTVVDSPFGYIPNCENDGYFKALQSNENHFFCVNVTTGKIFEETRVKVPERPISEEICQDYPDSWKKNF